MPEPTIKRGSDYFYTTIYEGNGGGQRVGNFVPFTDNGTIAKSCIFNRGDSPKLSKTPSSNGNRRTFTVSLWYKPTDPGNRRVLFSADTSGSDYLVFELNANDKLFFTHSSVGDIISTRTFEDTSKFYHFMCAVDTTQSTASNRVKLYVDGDQITALDSSTYPSQNFDTNVNSTSYPMAVGSFNNLTNICTGGFLAEVNFVDGTALTPSTFGLTDTSTGRWIPKSLTGITYGTNGFRMEFANSAGQTIGDDTSGNTNDYTVSNIATTDLTTDSPTQNHMNMGGRKGSSITMAEGNLKASVGAADTQVLSSIGLPTSGKWYWEVKLTTLSTYGRVGVTPEDAATSSHPLTAGMGYDRPETSNGVRIKNVDIGSGWDGSFTEGNVMNFALDADNKFMYIGENNTWRNSGNPTSGATGTGGIPYGSEDFANKILHPAVGSGAAGGTKVFEFDFGQKGFAYTPPTGYSAPQQDNFPTTDKGIPDFVWIKNRDQGDAHTIYDSTRGPTKEIGVEEVDETTDDDGLTKFLKGGFAIEDNVKVNSTGESYVAWNWIANGGTTAANTDGSGASIASVTQANQTAGFSIITHTGTGSAGTIAHGLSQAPEMVWTKIKAASVSGFTVGCSADPTSSGGFNQFLYLNENTNSRASSSTWNNTAPTNKVFSVGTSATTNNSSAEYLTFCWHSVEGFSKIGGYTGNGNADGIFVYTGFKPVWLITKKTSGSGNWCIMDSTRSPINPLGFFINADSGIAEVTTSTRQTDFLSNGFKFRGANDATNLSGQSYIFMAFAEHPFIGDGTNPATAR